MKIKTKEKRGWESQISDAIVDAINNHGKLREHVLSYQITGIFSFTLISYVWSLKLN